MAENRPITFDRSSGERIANVVRHVEGQGLDLSGEQARAGAYRYTRMFWAGIATSTETSTGSGVYKHAWGEVRRTETGWEPLPPPEGRIGTTTEGYALATTGEQVDPDTKVLMRLDFDEDGEPHYTFSVGGGDDETVVVKITGNASGGGKYNGRLMSPPSNAGPTGTLAMPEGMGVPGADDALLLNPYENGLNTHSLAANSYQVGQVVGVTTTTPTGRKIAVLALQRYSRFGEDR